MPLPTRPQRYCDPASLVIVEYVAACKIFYLLYMVAMMLFDTNTGPDGRTDKAECRVVRTRLKSRSRVIEHLEW